MTKKRCTRCKGFLPISHFSKRGRAHFMPWCKACKRTYDRIAVAKKRAAKRAAA